MQSALLVYNVNGGNDIHLAVMVIENEIYRGILGYFTRSLCQFLLDCKIQTSTKFYIKYCSLHSTQHIMKKMRRFKVVRVE